MVCRLKANSIKVCMLIVVMLHYGHVAVHQCRVALIMNIALHRDHMCYIMVTLCYIVITLRYIVITLRYIVITLRYIMVMLH